ncbi:MAG: hypothetical protein ABIC39_02180 [Pseudomonadota bacterium]
MAKLKEMTGKTFGRLTVIARSQNDKNNSVMWICICECKKTVIARGDMLRSGNAKSCGCLKTEITRKKWTGKGNPEWLGDKVGYDGAHIWIRKNKPKPLFCESCREKPPAELSYNNEKGNWKRNKEDYQWLCVSCHKLKDAGKNAKPLTAARIHRIREFYKAGAGTHKNLAELFMVSKSTITKIINHKGNFAEGKQGR